MATTSLLEELGETTITYDKMASVYLHDACDVFKRIAGELSAHPVHIPIIRKEAGEDGKP
jgi:hypothetical protein